MSLGLLVFNTNPKLYLSLRYLCSGISDIITGRPAAAYSNSLFETDSLKFKEISSKEKTYKWKLIGPKEYKTLSNKYSSKIKNWETKQYNIRSKDWKYN